jgi:DGQHR domain-containing protein
MTTTENPRRVALVGCSKRKAKTDPGQKLPARELYAPSHLFRLQLAEAHATAPHVFIMSAEHGLVELDEPLATYDRSVAQLTPEQRAQLGRRVVQSLVDRFRIFEAQPLEIHVFAGGPYVEVLRGAMPEGWRIVDPLAGQTLFERRTTLRTAAARRSQQSKRAELRLPALRIQQAKDGRAAYSFAVDGKLVPTFATISRVRREDGQITGYQRPESLAHVENIRRYMETPQAMVPNAVVLAFDSRVRFEYMAEDESGTVMGTLVIPLEDGPDWLKPGFVVDGQQRLAAVREAQLQAFPLFCSAFITDSQSEQAEQFLLVNSVKPVPKGLIYELLPSTTATLPPALEARKLPATLVERVNRREDSPLRGIIKTVTNPSGIATDTAFLNALENSIREGVLHRYWNRGRPDLEKMERWIAEWWGAVQDVFPGEWGKKPKDSRLFHGAGVVALFLLMDTVADRLGALGVEEPTRAQLVKELAYVKDDCAWSAGTWDFGAGQQRQWNHLQNTRQDVERLARLLTLVYRERSKGKPTKRERKK